MKNYFTSFTPSINRLVKPLGSLCLIAAVSPSTCLAGSGSAEKKASPRYKIEKCLEIAKVPAGFPVRFGLLTSDTLQYVAYYDSEHRMTVASRSLDSETWEYHVLPSKVGWDSHNSIKMALDDEGQLHLSGNMHADPLVYFRTEKPGDISTLKRSPMTGKDENRATYPNFLTNHKGDLIFHYRNGGSGRGVTFYNIYDVKTRTWSRLLDEPLLDGESERNAYPIGPTLDPEGWFHLVWVWRDTPDSATNHHLSHARSRDLVHWESAFGETIKSPITLGNKASWVDPIPSGGGIINNAQRLFFGADNRPIIAYHKSDEQGNMQIYAARAEDGKWVVHQLTDWDQPIIFGGGGTMGFIGIRISGLSLVEPGLLTMTYTHRDYGEGRLVIDEKTLQPLDRTVDLAPEFPAELNIVQSDFDGMGIRRVGDDGTSQEPGVRYLLQWETLAQNHDRPRQPPLPEPSLLKLYKLSGND